MIDSIETSNEALKTMVPIAESERQTALKFAAEQPTREKARQVYLNTLAVLTVKRCLDLSEIATDLAASDSWNPFCRLGADLADLKVTGAGYLECRPVTANQQECFIPPEALENRIGYLVVQLSPPYQDATILGFIPNVVQVRLPLSQLQPLPELFLHLESLRVAPRPIVHLRQWLNNAVDAAWQTAEDVLSATAQPTFAFRNFRNIKLNPDQIQRLVEQLYASQHFGSVRLEATDKLLELELKAVLAHFIQTTPDEALRWKAVEILWMLDPGNPAAGVRRVMDLGLLLAGQRLALMVAVLQSSDDRRVSVLARVYPLKEQRYVPNGLQLTVLSADGSSSCEVQAREHDNYIQLILRAEFGEQFSIGVALKEDSITEYFAI